MGVHLPVYPSDCPNRLRPVEARRVPHPLLSLVHPRPRSEPVHRPDRGSSTQKRPRLSAKPRAPFAVSLSWARLCSLAGSPPPHRIRIDLTSSLPPVLQIP